MFLGIMTEIMLMYQTAKVFAILIQILVVIVIINSIIGFITVIRLFTNSSRNRQEKHQLEREETFKREITKRGTAMRNMEREILSLRAKIEESEKKA